MSKSDNLLKVLKEAFLVFYFNSGNRGDLANAWSSFDGELFKVLLGCNFCGDLNGLANIFYFFKIQLTN